MVHPVNQEQDDPKKVLNQQVVQLDQLMKNMKHNVENAEERKKISSQIEKQMKEIGKTCAECEKKKQFSALQDKVDAFRDTCCDNPENADAALKKACDCINDLRR